MRHISHFSWSLFLEMFSTPWIFSFSSKFLILISGSHKAQLRWTQAFSFIIFSFRYISIFCFFWACFLLFELLFWFLDWGLVFGFWIFGRLIFEEEIKFVLDSNFSDFLLLFIDELEYIDSVSFTMFDEFITFDEF